MASRVEFTFLSDEFYTTYPADEYSEIERKVDRPYTQVIISLSSVIWAIPLRSHIAHPHVFWTDKANGCGIDYTKAVPVIKEEYFDRVRQPHIRQKEFNAMRGKGFRIKKGFEKYISDYFSAKSDLDKAINKTLVEKSTLQYFEEYLNTEQDSDTN